MTADREVHALESRSDSLDATSIGSFVRVGESGQIEVGMGSPMGGAASGVEATCGTLAETPGHNPNRMTGAVGTGIRGSHKTDGKDDMPMATRAMAEAQAGGTAAAGGQSDGLFGIAHKEAAGPPDRATAESPGMNRQSIMPPVTVHSPDQEVDMHNRAEHRDASDGVHHRLKPVGVSRQDNRKQRCLLAEGETP